jgi:hypothetical protein
MEDMIGVLTLLVGLVIIIFLIASWWKLFTKSGWPGWQLIAFFIPYVNIIISCVVYYKLAVNFGKGLFVHGRLVSPVLYILSNSCLGRCGIYW